MDVISDRTVRVAIEAQPSDAPEFLVGTPFEPQLSENNNEASCSGARRRTMTDDYVDDGVAAPGHLVPLRRRPLQRPPPRRSFRLIVFRCTTSTKPPPLSTAASRHHRQWRWSWSCSWSHLSSHVGRLFYWLQLASALACVSLSAARLARQDFGDAADARTNRRSALDIFYGLVLAEALLFLAEKAAWEWEVTYGRLLERVAAECRLASAPSGLAAVRRFFYDTYVDL
ncbi:unnamed protein product [Urochloa humidicola]